MYCPSCGTHNDDNNFRCVQCSTVIQQGAGGPMGGAPGGYAQAFPEASQATTAVILAAVSWVVCGPFLSVPALFMARTELRAIEAGLRDPVNQGTAKAAFWVAVINVGISVLAILFYIVFIVLIFGSMNKY